MVWPMKLSTHLQGHSAVGWPKIKIEFNNQILWDQEIIDEVMLDFDVTACQNNRLIIQHYGKKPEHVIMKADGTYQDRWCHLKSIHIDKVMIDLNFLSDCDFYYVTDEGERLITDYLGKEGKLIIEFSMPMWKFWEEYQYRSRWCNPMGDQSKSSRVQR